MIEAFPRQTAAGRVAILLHPSAVPVVDVFRSLGSLEDQYDLALLDGPERALAAYVEPEAASGIVSDALLLAFALFRQRGRSFSHEALRSRHGSRDEYCLMTLISAARAPASELALEAAAALEVVPPDGMSALAGELVRHVESGSLVFGMPSLAEFRAIAGNPASLENGTARTRSLRY